MSKLPAAFLLGALSILLLAGLARVDPSSNAPGAAIALPAVPADAPRSDSPRECSIAKNIVTACTYQ